MTAIFKKYIFLHLKSCEKESTPSLYSTFTFTFQGKIKKLSGPYRRRLAKEKEFATVKHGGGGLILQPQDLDTLQ